jgi:mxaL protein
MSRLARGWQLARRYRHLGLLALTSALLLVTLAHPSVLLPGRTYRFMIVLDITQSMNTPDYTQANRRISRLAFAKQALRQVLADLPCGSQAGLGIFTGYRSFLLFEPVEVCAHEPEILASLAGLDWRVGWSGNSEIGKAVHSALKIAASIEPVPTLVFVTDGHEAPPIDPRYAPAFDGELGRVHGLIVGAGGLTPQPIPKYDMEGHELGFWKPTEVMQVDPYSAGRQTSVPGGEPMAGAPNLAPPSSGIEHLSWLHESYLQGLAHDLQLNYVRLSDARELGAAMRQAQFAHRARARHDLRWWLGACALLALLASYTSWGFARRP